MRYNSLTRKININLLILSTHGCKQYDEYLQRLHLGYPTDRCHSEAGGPRTAFVLRSYQLCSRRRLITAFTTGNFRRFYQFFCISVGNQKSICTLKNCERFALISDFKIFTFVNSHAILLTFTVSVKSSCSIILDRTNMSHLIHEA